MLAQLTLAMGPRTVVATLLDDFHWECEDLLTQTYLNACHGPVDDGCPACGPAGYGQARRAASAVQAAGWDVSFYMPALSQTAA